MDIGGSQMTTTVPVPGQDWIQVLAPDRTARSVKVQAQSLAVGRAGDNQLVLEDKKVSRHHALIEFDGTDYSVTDLESSNGTFLGTIKLPPGERQLWPPDKSMRLGDHHLRLVRHVPPLEGGGILLSSGKLVDTELLHSSPGEDLVVYLEVCELRVAPGQIASTSLTILNKGEEEDYFQVRVEGVPREWLRASLSDIRLAPGHQREVTLSFIPPRSYESRAGSYSLTVRVSSRNAPHRVAEVEATLNVTPFTQYQGELKPRKIQGGKVGRLAVANQGNMTRSFRLTWQDLAHELAFEPEQAELHVEAGQVAEIEFQAARRNRRLLGASEDRFEVKISSKDGQVQRVTGEVVGKGLIPIGPELLLGMLSLLAAIVTILVGLRSTSPAVSKIGATATPLPTPTPTRGPIYTPPPSSAAFVLPEFEPANVTGDIVMVGSEDVNRLSDRIYERFKSEGYPGHVQIDFTGTGAGFKRFCEAGDADVANAQRPITGSELEACQANGLDPIEFRVGTQALAVVVSQENDFIGGATYDQLAKIFAEATRWSEVNPDWPDQEIVRFVPELDTDTFDFFVHEVFKKKEEPILRATNIRRDADEVLVEGVLRNPYAVGVVGYAHYIANADELRALAIEKVEPTAATLDSGDYPFARPLLIYTTGDIMRQKPQVADFLNYYLTFVNEEIVHVGYYPVSPGALDASRLEWLDTMR
jgi:phosphate transport system substrate-binding protein